MMTKVYALGSPGSVCHVRIDGGVACDTQIFAWEGHEIGSSPPWRGASRNREGHHELHITWREASNVHGPEGGVVVKRT